MAIMGKKSTEYCIPLGMVRFREPVQAARFNDSRFDHGKPAGLEMFAIGEGVVIKREGYSEALIPYTFVKCMEPRYKISFIESEHLMSPKEQEQIGRVVAVKAEEAKAAERPKDRIK